MIEIIIKRDGTEEPFTANKINGWGEWGSKNLGNYIDWGTAVMAVVAQSPKKCSSDDVNHSLIRYLLAKKTWAHQRMAGRIYAAIIHKDFYGKNHFPTIKELHEKLLNVGYMVRLAYTDEEYAYLNSIIDHERDFDYTHTQLHQLRYKYALRNYQTKEEYESPQFIFMRMAMALGEDQPGHRRLEDVVAWYEMFSQNIINAPTPNYTNLGTKLRGFASCCLYEAGDTADSLAIGDHIAYKMTVNAAGIGSILNTRSKDDPVRGGLFLHRGKYYYLDSARGAVEANVKNGRNGACTTYFSMFDPEHNLLVNLKNPMTVRDKQNMGLDYAWMSNKFIGRKAARKEQIFLFNSYTAPDLCDAFFSGDLEHFEEIYNRYEADPKFTKHYMSARDIVVNIENQAYETGRTYLAFMDEINRHTTFKEPIKCSNLCTEITEPVEAYQDMRDLYSDHAVGFIRFIDSEGMQQRFDAEYPVKFFDGTWNCAQNLKEGSQFFIDDGFEVRETTVVKILEVKKEPEVAMCSLAGIVIPNVKDDAMYQKAAYYSLLMIDKCIHMSDYPLPHIGYTAKQRLSAGVGMMSLAHYMARKNLKYSSLEGKQEIHRVAETHAYWVTRASLELGKELGNAPWIHRTKWPEGWLFIDTYQRGIDELVPGLQNLRDWETLRAEIIANGGIRNSSLIAHMPGESSSKASGGTNSLYPARSLATIKSDNDNITYWCAPESDLLGDNYELAYGIPTFDMIDCYGVIQKWTDQAISADEYAVLIGASQVSSDTILKNFFRRLKAGMKSRYYLNSKTAKKVVLGKADADGVPSDVGTAAESPVPAPVDITKRPQPLMVGEVTTDEGSGYREPAAEVVNGDITEGEVTTDANGDRVTYVFEDSADSNSAGCESGACSL
jgi:ribonucleoside-diphosphate reductase alpha chain